MFWSQARSAIDWLKREPNPVLRSALLRQFIIFERRGSECHLQCGNDIRLQYGFEVAAPTEGVIWTKDSGAPREALPRLARAIATSSNAMLTGMGMETDVGAIMEIAEFAGREVVVHTCCEASTFENVVMTLRTAVASGRWGVFLNLNSIAPAISKAVMSCITRVLDALRCDITTITIARRDVMKMGGAAILCCMYHILCIFTTFPSPIPPPVPISIIINI